MLVSCWLKSTKYGGRDDDYLSHMSLEESTYYEQQVTYYNSITSTFSLVSLYIYTYDVIKHTEPDLASELVFSSK